MKSGIEGQVDEFVTACHEVARRGLVLGSAGNVSWRVAEDLLLISPAGVSLAAVTADEVAHVDLRTSQPVAGKRPTSELDLHLAVIAGAETVRAIVHTHSPAATAFSIAREPIPFICNESLAVRTGAIRVTEYAPPGSPELAAEALRGLQAEPDARAVLLANHGVVSVGDSLDVAIGVASQVEWLAEVYLRARQIGEPRTIAPEHQQAMAENYNSPYRPAGLTAGEAR